LDDSASWRRFRCADIYNPNNERLANVKLVGCWRSAKPESFLWEREPRIATQTVRSRHGAPKAGYSLTSQLKGFRFIVFVKTFDGRYALESRSQRTIEPVRTMNQLVSIRVTSLTLDDFHGGIALSNRKPRKIRTIRSRAEQPSSSLSLKIPTPGLRLTGPLFDKDSRAF